MDERTKNLIDECRRLEEHEICRRPSSRVLGGQESASLPNGPAGKNVQATWS